MALTTANVDTTSHTFQTWVDKTNILLDAYSTSIVTTAANSSGGKTSGNATVNGIFTANSVTVSGNSTFGLRGGNVTTNATLFITSNVSIGNTSVNTVIDTTTIDTDLMLTVLGNTSFTNGTVTFTTNSTSNVYTFGAGNSSFDSGVLFVDAVNNRVGINNTAPGVALRVTGSADISSTANIQGNANVGGTLGVVGNTTLSGALQTIAGNTNFDSGVLFVDATNNRVGINSTTPVVALDVVGSANISVSVNSAQVTVGTSFIANTSGAYHTGVINAASHTTSGFVANTTAIVPTSNTILLGNTTGRFVLSANTGSFSGAVDGITTLAAGNTTITGFANVTTSVNSAILSVGTAFIANTSGAYHTGIINAASHTTSGFVANTTAIVPTSNTILLGNSIGRFILSANTGSFSGAVSGITTLAAGNTTVTGFVNATSTIQGGSSLTIAGALSGVTTSAMGNTTITGFANVTGTVQGGDGLTMAGNSSFDSGVLFVDATNNRVGINNTAPGVALRVTGDVDISSTANIQGNANVGGNLGILGNTAFTGNTTFNGTLQTISGNVNIDSGTLFIDSVTDSVKVKNLSTNTGSIYINSGTLSGVTMMSIANGNIGSNITTAQTVASFTKTLYPTGQLTITASNSTHNQIEQLIYAHDGTDVQTTVFGRIAAPASANLGIANVVINGSLLEINFNQAAISTKINILANLFTP